MICWPPDIRGLVFIRGQIIGVPPLAMVLIEILIVLGVSAWIFCFVSSREPRTGIPPQFGWADSYQRSRGVCQQKSGLLRSSPAIAALRALCLECDRESSFSDTDHPWPTRASFLRRASAGLPPPAALHFARARPGFESSRGFAYRSTRVGSISFRRSSVGLPPNCRQ